MQVECETQNPEYSMAFPCQTTSWTWFCGKCTSLEAAPMYDVWGISCGVSRYMCIIHILDIYILNILDVCIYIYMYILYYIYSIYYVSLIVICSCLLDLWYLPLPNVLAASFTSHAIVQLRDQDMILPTAFDGLWATIPQNLGAMVMTPLNDHHNPTVPSNAPLNASFNIGTYWNQYHDFSIRSRCLSSICRRYTSSPGLSPPACCTRPGHGMTRRSDSKWPRNPTLHKYWPVPALHTTPTFTFPIRKKEVTQPAHPSLAQT
jgi:hypothetical protein